MVDEYQDSNLVQEMITNLVSGWADGRKNFFMVGDVKQSIYRFRLARPELFMEKYDTYSVESSPCQRIDLHKNFRSRKEVLDSTNYLFEKLMFREFGGIEYDENAALYAGAEFPPIPEDAVFTDKTEVLIFNQQDMKTRDAKEAEARMIARRIREMMGSGYIYDKDGIITEEKINYLLEMRASGRDRCEDYADKFGVPFYKGEKPWGIKVDIAMPCATQNEIGIKEAKQIIANGTKYYIEVANMPTTEEALNFLIDRNDVIVAPSKAVNAGGVCVSGLEMSQNSQRLSWTAEEVDEKLHNAMINIHKHSVEAAEKYGLGYDLVAGANIAGFEKVAEAMMAQGIV